MFENISSVKSKKKNQRKPAVKISRPVTRNQKKEGDLVEEVCNSTVPPGRVIRSQFHKKRSK